MKRKAPEDNKFHQGNGDDGKHYWITPPALYTELDAQYHFDFDPCPCPKPAEFDGLTCEWGRSSYVNPPFGSIMHDGKKKGPTAWARKALTEQQKGKRVVLVYPIDKWVLMLIKAGAKIDLVFQLDINEWNGERKLQLVMQDFRSNHADPDTF